MLLGFPISIYGIVIHLTHYCQPNIQCYVVRILFMVQVYSIKSWLYLRFFALAICIELLRDYHRAYVLHSFFQFLIKVLGGKNSLILMMKDKSPACGYHCWPLNYCLKP